MLNQNWGDNKGLKWLEKNNIQREDYRNGQLNGNACKKLLENLNKLRSQLPRKLRKYVNALDAFNNVRKSCFGQTLEPDFKTNILLFQQAYDCLGVPYTNKVHVLIDHVPYFCDLKKKGLGFFSEQAR